MKPLAWVLGFAVVPAQAEVIDPVPPRADCPDCVSWNRAQDPFRIFGNTYYVGPRGLGSLLLTSDEGHVLLDGGLPESAPVIAANIERLGFRVEDIRWIAVTHEHYDHVGGVAALARASGATVVGSPSAARALMAGNVLGDDPQQGFGATATAFPSVPRAQGMADGEVLRIGPISLVAHHTPGHTPGSTTWTWRSCESDRCLDLVYLDSLNAVSAPGFRYSGDGDHASRVESFRASMAKVAGLPCDIAVSVHPGFTQMADKLARRASRAAGEPDPFIDRDACRRYADDAAGRLGKRVAEEQAEPGGSSTRKP